MRKELDIIIPISLDSDWPTKDIIIDDIMELYNNYSFTRFALTAPCGGWRAVGFPPREFYEERAKLFAEVKSELSPYGIDCGWWITATLKSGRSDEFTGVVREDGTESPFQNCPFDENFKRQFAEMTALFAEIAKPAFIITEDDYTLGTGCFCKNHLDEFASREGKYYSRDELLSAFNSDTEEGYALMRRWRELTKESLVSFADAIRKEVDKKSPEIPIGYMQSGAADYEGDATEAIARALAGPNHTPFSRLFGVAYCGIESKDIPHTMFHPLYSKQHIKGDFDFYHESDTFPHTRFFTEGKQMKVIMSAAYSYGYIGSTFNIRQLLDDANEEKTFPAMFKSERKKFNALFNAVKGCRITGAQLCYDPFWNTADKKSTEHDYPLWIRAVSLFGIPHTTEESDVAFWDIRQAKHADDETVLKYLSKGLFLDGTAAKALCERGFGEYLGVEIGDDVATHPLCWDLGAREIICEKFRTEGKGKNMPAAHMFANGRNGKLLKITVTDQNADVISEEYNYLKEFISPAMTRFENKLGGKVVILGQTLNDNYSQSLFNYRRKKLFEELLLWCGDKYLFVRKEPNIYTIVNEPVSDKEFMGIVTLINLGADTISDITLHLPEKWAVAKRFYILNQDGEWEKAECVNENQELKLGLELDYCEPLYLMIK